MAEVKLKVKCVCCDFKKEVGSEQREQPMCDKCFSPMVAEGITVTGAKQ